MSIVRIISALIFLGTLTAFGMGLIPDQSNALAARSADEAVLARDAATSRNDIDLTNSCIEAGESKEHCLCVTKVFKYEMSLREYKAAIKLYQSVLSDEPTMRSSVKMALLVSFLRENVRQLRQDRLSACLWLKQKLPKPLYRLISFLTSFAHGVGSA